jgi:hypothetical protein
MTATARVRKVVGICGGGISGSVAAKALASYGYEVHLFYYLDSDPNITPIPPTTYIHAYIHNTYTLFKPTSYMSLKPMPYTLFKPSYAICHTGTRCTCLKAEEGQEAGRPLGITSSTPSTTGNSAVICSMQCVPLYAVQLYAVHLILICSYMRGTRY